MELTHGDKDISMNSRTFFGASALAIALSLGIASAATAGVDDCMSELDAVAAAIDAGDFANQMDRTRLNGKVIQAQAKVNIDKCSNALDKLDSINDKVADLSDGIRKQKLSPAAATAIMDATGSAAQCIASLTTCGSK